MTGHNWVEIETVDAVTCICEKRTEGLIALNGGRSNYKWDPVCIEDRISDFSCYAD
jgi:hypothetical protein